MLKVFTNPRVSADYKRDPIDHGTPLLLRHYMSSDQSISCGVGPGVHPTGSTNQRNILINQTCAHLQDQSGSFPKPYCGLNPKPPKPPKPMLSPSAKQADKIFAAIFVAGASSATEYDSITANLQSMFAKKDAAD